MTLTPPYALQDDPGIRPLADQRPNILSAGYIRSKNYSAGATGWNIDSAGNAEFNNITVRGTVAASTITGSTITGGLFRTAASGRRVEMNSVTAVGNVTFYSGDANESVAATVGASTSGTQLTFSMDGPVRSGAGQARILMESPFTVGGTDSLLSLDGDTIVIGSGTTKLAFFNGTPGGNALVVTGSRGGNAALTSLLTALATYGLVVDLST